MKNKCIRILIGSMLAMSMTGCVVMPYGYPHYYHGYHGYYGHWR